MANGKEPKTTGEHIVALYGHITGLKRDLKELREESSHMHEKFERKFDNLTWWIIAGLGSTIAILLTLAFNLMK
jgi:pheromone shutdown protein TraB